MKLNVREFPQHVWKSWIWPHHGTTIGVRSPQSSLATFSKTKFKSYNLSSATYEFCDTFSIFITTALIRILTVIKFTILWHTVSLPLVTSLSSIFPYYPQLRFLKHDSWHFVVLIHGVLWLLNSKLHL